VSTKLEFDGRSGHVHVGRLVQEAELDKERALRVHPQLRIDPWKSQTEDTLPVVLYVETPGMLDTMRFTEDPRNRDGLGLDEVEMETLAWPISLRDVSVALGRLGNEGLGFECAGVVTRTGSACSTLFQPGGRIIMALLDVCAAIQGHQPAMSSEFQIISPSTRL
jgi:hypothetical protein